MAGAHRAAATFALLSIAWCGVAEAAPSKPKHNPTPPPKRELPLCYKDYCPCEPPQGGMDYQLCDMLEAGLPVDIEALIAGRTFRKVREDLRKSPY